MKDPIVNRSGGPSGAGAGSTDLSLLGRVRSNDPVAWQRMVGLYGPTVYAWCRRAGMAAENAADVVQDVFHAVARRIGSFRRDRTGDTFAGWLWTITRHKITDQIRRRGRQVEAVGGDDALRRLGEVAADDVADEGSTISTRGDATLVRRALELIRADIEPRTWDAFWRTAVEGHDAVEVAAELGLSRNAVYIAKSRVLQRLRKELEGLIG